MSEEELDETYTLTCATLTEAGEAGKELFLCRLALLLMHQIDDPARIRLAIAEARDVLAH